MSDGASRTTTGQESVSSRPRSPIGFCGRTRREFLWETGAGFTGVALSALLDRDGFFNSPALAGTATSPHSLENPLVPLPSHFPGKAKRCIFLFMYGGPSQMDLFDFKPELQKRDGQTLNVEVRHNLIAPQTLMASKRKFLRRGAAGHWCSDALPCLATQMDKLAVVKSLTNDSFAHASALIQMNSGRITQGDPCLGSWVTYGLGTLNENLPGFVVMLDPRGGPIAGASNWMSGYMPAAYQGTVLRSTGRPILNLSPASSIDLRGQRAQVQAINALNVEHLASRPGYTELQARIAAYELAFQLQSTAPDALDISQETRETQERYGLHDPLPPHKQSLGSGPFGRQCLIARRLVERGVRFVQIYHGGGHGDQNWDAHSNVNNNLQMHCPEIDKPIAGLLADLEARGLLDETLVIWGGEFGRQAVSQNALGRDHNPKGFTYWLAGGGIKPGVSYGETDEIGHEAVVHRRHIRDLHATILRTMGFDHRHLTYFHSGLNQRLTDVVEAKPITEILV